MTDRDVAKSLKRVNNYCRLAIVGVGGGVLTLTVITLLSAGDMPPSILIMVVSLLLVVGMSGAYIIARIEKADVYLVHENMTTDEFTAYIARLHAIRDRMLQERKPYLYMDEQRKQIIAITKERELRG